MTAGTAALPRRLGRQRVLARLALGFEQLWPALWPAIGLAGLFVALALFDVPALVPAWLHVALLAGFGAGCALLAWRGLRGLRLPGAEAADRMIERASGLRHQPLAVLSDRPAFADPHTDALWRAHVARATATLRHLRVGLPHPGLAGRDPRALRGGLVVLLAAGLVVAGPDTLPRLGRAFAPDLPIGPPPVPTQLQAWITPPGYTGLPPVFLHAAEASVSVPAGSRLTISLTGGTGEPGLVLDGHVTPFRALDHQSWQAERDLTTGARVVVRRHGRQMAAWDITTIVDMPPTVAFSEPPGRAPHRLLLRLPWKAEDDYGVASLQAEIRLRDRPTAPPLIVPIPLPGQTPKSAHGAALRDLTANPWAGLPVIARLVARDAIGQKGVSDTAGFVLPARIFTHPVARALIALRRWLSVHPEDRAKVITGLARLAAAPDAFDNDYSVFVNLTALAALLAHDPDDAAVPQAQERMWQLALHLEDGAPERTARDLQRARQAVEDALAQAQRTGHLDKAELDRRMQALEDAIERRLRALVEQARRDGTETPFDPNARHLSDRDLQQMVERMREAARRGDTQSAEQQMAQLEQILRQLQNAQPGQAQDAQSQQQRQQGRQQMGALQDMVGREGQLLDHSQSRTGSEQDPLSQQDSQLWQQFRALNPDIGPLPSDRPAPSPQQQAQDRAHRDADARTQRALRRALGELMQQFGDLTGKIPQSLGQADQAMHESAQSLQRGNDSGAAAAEQRAIEALQKGGHEMAQQMAQQFGAAGQPGVGEGQDGMQGQGGEGGQAGDTGGQGRYGRSGMRDPLGRMTQEGTGGADLGNDVQVPEKMEQARSREIQRELRRRGAERTRPQEELDYIDRLLKMY